MVLSLCDRIYVLNSGQLLAQGTPAEIKAHAEVRAAYLGSTVEAMA
jgi:ABC-type branched-subunit amino acid transport system ATPase component